MDTISLWSCGFLVLFLGVSMTLQEDRLEALKKFNSQGLNEDLVATVIQSIYDAELSSVISKQEWKYAFTRAGEARLKGRSATKNTCRNLLKDKDCRYLKSLGQCLTRKFKLEGLCPKECGFCSPTVQNCRLSPFGCCPDKTNAAQGPNFQGCPEQCTDKRGKRFCQIVARLNYCMTTYGNFAETCAFSCGFCRSCKDIMPMKCLHAADFGSCEALKPTMMNDCRKTCNFCGKRDLCFNYKGCSKGSSCFIHDDEKPMCRCQKSCLPGDYHTGKVCGRNNREYKNLCELKQTFCNGKQKLIVRNFGKCMYIGSPNRAPSPAKCMLRRDFPFCDRVNTKIFCSHYSRAELCPLKCKLCGSNYALPGCNYGRFGCCLDGQTPAEGVGNQGCSALKRKCKDLSKTLCVKFVALCGHGSHLHFMKKHCPSTCGWC